MSWGEKEMKRKKTHNKTICNKASHHFLCPYVAKRHNTK